MIYCIYVFTFYEISRVVYNIVFYIQAQTYVNYIYMFFHIDMYIGIELVDRRGRSAGE